MKFALRNGAYVIVCEHLNFSGSKKKGEKTQQLHMWKCRTIINKLEHNAHKYKMRFARVNPKNTSALAFDGSGYIKRDKDNASLCTFPTGITPTGKISYINSHPIKRNILWISMLILLYMNVKKSLE